MSELWFRVPLDAAKTLTGAHKASRNEAMVDLLGRWHLGGDPGPRELMRAWDWSGDRVAKLRREMVEWCRESGGTCPDLRPDKIGRRPDSDRTPAGQVKVEETPVIEQAPDANRTPTGQAPDAPRAGGDQDFRENQKKTDPPKPPEGGPSLMDRKPRRARTRAETAPKSEQDTLYGVFHGYHPLSAPAPTPDTRKALDRLLTECGGVEPACVYLAWVHESLDEYALQIRGLAPWPDGKPKARHSVEELGRHIGARMPSALAWDQRGRTAAPAPHPHQGAPPGTRTHAERVLAGEAD